MYLYRCKHKREYTQYSQTFDKLKDALLWYKNTGKNIEKRFNRTLILFEDNKPFNV